MDVKTAASAALNYAATRPATAPDPSGAQGKLRDFAQEFTDTLRASEQMSQKAVAGQADPVALVQALAQAELAVEAAVTIRDKVVEAYQEILRMPV